MYNIIMASSHRPRFKIRKMRDQLKPKGYVWYKLLDTLETSFSDQTYAGKFSTELYQLADIRRSASDKFFPKGKTSKKDSQRYKRKINLFVDRLIRYLMEDRARLASFKQYLSLLLTTSKSYILKV